MKNILYTYTDAGNTREMGLIFTLWHASDMHMSADMGSIEDVYKCLYPQSAIGFQMRFGFIFVGGNSVGEGIASYGETTWETRQRIEGRNARKSSVTELHLIPLPVQRTDLGLFHGMVGWRPDVVKQGGVSECNLGATMPS